MRIEGRGASGPATFHATLLSLACCICSPAFCPAQVDVYTAFHDPSRCFAETVGGPFSVTVAGGWFPRHILGRAHALCAYIRCALVALYIAWLSWRRQLQYDVIITDQVTACVACQRGEFSSGTPSSDLVGSRLAWQPGCATASFSTAAAGVSRQPAAALADRGPCPLLLPLPRPAVSGAVQRQHVLGQYVVA